MRERAFHGRQPFSEQIRSWSLRDAAPARPNKKASPAAAGDALSSDKQQRCRGYITLMTSMSTLVTFSAFSLKMVTISSQLTGGSSVFQQS